MIAPRAPESMSFVILGLSITSAWGNGHATTYRALVRHLAARGHLVLFLERDVPWYAAHRDHASPAGARTVLYRSLAELQQRFHDAIRDADVVIVGSYVPEGIDVGRWVTGVARGVTAFYDIDTPVTLARLRSGGTDYLSRELIPRYDLYLSFTGGPTLERLENEFGARMARPLYCSVDPDHYSPTDEEPACDLGYLGTYSDDRQPVLTELMLRPALTLPMRRFIVAGAQYPRSITWPANVVHVPHVAPSEHRQFYTSQRYTLNVTRADMVLAGWSPSVRLFEAAACGTPIISDDWPGLSELFEPGREILIARSARDTRAYLHELSEAERVAIGSRGRARVLDRHTAAHRAEQLEQFVAEARRAAGR